MYLNPSNRKHARSNMSSIGYMLSSIACILGLTFATAAAHAQGLVVSGSSFTVGTTPQGMATGDLNVDGHPDMVVANSASNNISVLLSNGIGTYDPAVNYTTGTKPVAVALGDFAGNGLLDVAVVDATSHDVEIFTNLVAGKLSPTPTATYTVGTTPAAIVTGDFNNDGKLDLAVANSGSGNVTILLGNGDGTFTSSGSFAAGTTPVALAVGYFNGVRNADLAVVDSANKQVDVLIGTGTGSFGAATKFAVGTKPSSVGVADFNHDGHPDLAVANATDGTVSVLWGAGGGSFTTPATTLAAGTTPGSLIVTDVNSDGNPDIAVSNVGSGTVSVILNNGNKTFRTQQATTVSGGVAYLANIDLNQDGKPDILASQPGATLSVLINNTLATSPLPTGRNFQAATQSGAGNMAVAVVAADFNGDGIPDKAVAYLEDYTVGVSLGLGNGTFGAQTLYPVGKHPYALATADLNHDGSPDLVVANEYDGTVSVLLNTGTGTFAAAKTYTVGRLPTGVAIGDLNNDGIPDLAVTNYGANDVSILIGKGDGTFVPGSTPTLAGQTNPYNVVIADFNGDGNQDIAFTNYQSASMEVYLGNGNGSFQSPTILSTISPFPSSIAVADFNRDGMLDIAVGNTISNNITMFLGNDSGSFTASTVATLNFPVSIAVGDVNGDGIPDIVNVNPNYNDVTALLGNGDGTFTARWQFPTSTSTSPNTPGAQPWGIALADLNHDGKLDIITANTIARINLTIPAYQPALGAVLSPASPLSTSVLLNTSGAFITTTVSPTTIPTDKSTVTISTKVAGILAGTPTPTGAVEFEVDGAIFGTPFALDAAGTASVATAHLGSGNHIITTLYSGSTLYQPFTASGVTANVPGSRVTLTLVPNSVPFGSSSTYTITVYGTPGTAPTGTVALYNGGTNLTGNVTITNGDRNNAAGTSTVTGTLNTGTIPLNAGSYELVAQYNPGNDPAGVSPEEPFTVTTVQTTLTLNCFSILISFCIPTVTPAPLAPNNVIAYTYTVNGDAPTSGNTTSGSLITLNPAIFEGTATFTASFAAQGNYLASGPVSQTFSGIFGFLATGPTQRFPAFSFASGGTSNLNTLAQPTNLRTKTTGHTPQFNFHF